MIRRCAVALSLAALLSVLFLPAASAHVRVSSSDAVRGGYGMLTFRVPTESDTASTVGLTVTLPRDTPLASVSVLPVPGWTATRRTRKLDKPIRTDDGTLTSYVASVTWKADRAADGLRPGEFGLFSISAGPLPDRPRLVLPAVQRYSDGSTVAWDEVAEDQAAEPDHPAPVIDLRPASGPSAAAAPSATASPEHDPAGGAQPSGSGPATGWYAPAAAALAAIAVVLALVALLRTRRPD